MNMDQACGPSSGHLMVLESFFLSVLHYGRKKN